MTDFYNNRVRAISLKSGIVTSFVGVTTSGYIDGTGTNAMLCYPAALALDSKSGILFLADYNRIRKISTGILVFLLYYSYHT